MPEYHVPSVLLAVRMLKLLSRYKYQSCSLKEIASLLGSNPTTCLRVLQTLLRDDFVSYHSETKKYSLGPYLIPLGNRAMELNHAVGSAIGELKSVVEQTGLTTVLIERLKDNRLIYLSSEEPPDGNVKISVSVGQQFPIDKVAFGRCFLAYDDELEWASFVASVDPTESDGDGNGGEGPADADADADPDADAHESLIHKLREIRKQGYAVSHGELTPGVSSYAVPIFDRAGNVEFVMACLAMATPYAEEQESEVIRVLLEKSRLLSQRNRL